MRHTKPNGGRNVRVRACVLTVSGMKLSANLQYTLFRMTLFNGFSIFEGCHWYSNFYRNRHVKYANATFFRSFPVSRKNTSHCRLAEVWRFHKANSQGKKPVPLFRLALLNSNFRYSCQIQNTIRYKLGTLFSLFVISLK